MDASGMGIWIVIGGALMAALFFLALMMFPLLD